tara:strand:- start:3788 stop:3970 length:183 start_codon:yes stop_codon:yes gene_type:complete
MSNMETTKKGCGCAETGVCVCQVQTCGCDDHTVDAEQVDWVMQRLNMRTIQQQMKTEQEV